MTTATVADPDLEKMAAALGLSLPLPAVTSMGFWTRVMNTPGQTLNRWVDRGLFPRPIVRGRRKTCFITRQVLEHLARQQQGRAADVA